MTLPFVTRLQDQAASCEASETAFRREAEQRIQQLALARTHAYRRFNFMKELAARAAAIADEAERQASLVDLACANSDWSEGKAHLSEVKTALAPLSAAVCAATEGKALPDPLAAMTEFEAWYRQRFNSEFLDLLGQPPRDFSPVIDF